MRQSVSYRLLCIGSGVRKASSPAAIMRYVLRFDTAFKPALRHHFLYRLLPHRPAFCRGQFRVGSQLRQCGTLGMRWKMTGALVSFV